MKWFMIVSLSLAWNGGWTEPKMVVEKFESEYRCKRAVEALTRNDYIRINKWDCVNIARYED